MEPELTLTSKLWLPDRSEGGSRGWEGHRYVQTPPLLDDDDANEDEERSQLFRQAASGSCVRDLRLQQINNLGWRVKVEEVSSGCHPLRG